MKKQSNALILAALALGLVCTPLALVQASVDSGFRIINNAGGLIDVECSIPGSPSVEPFGNGDTEYLTCNGTVMVKMHKALLLLLWRRLFLFSARATKFKRLP